jgi:UDP-N-acetylmuramate dehydrogenase
MQIIHDTYLRNTLKLKSLCKTLYIPENTEDLKFIKRGHILGNGSNLLLNEVIETVIDTSKLNTKIEFHDGIITCGCSVRIQELIRYAQNLNLGGIEFLYSVPGLMGGIVCMNAGTRDKSISQFVKGVRIFDGELKYFTKEECQFTYRDSIFKERYLIYEVDLVLENKSYEKIEQGIKDRLKAVKSQDNSYPNAGTVFCKSSRISIRLSKMLKWGNARFSKKTSNWIVNLGNATYRDIKMLIKMSKFLHLFKQPKLEWVDWKR